MADTITKIYPSDLISDSMVKINRNFDIILNRDDVTESKLNQWTENIENKLADIRNENGIISSTILNNVQKLENKIDNLTNLDDITKEVENAINNATIDVEGLINDKADELIFSKLDDYVKTSTLNKRLEEYVKSNANFNIDSSGNVAVKATSLQIKKSEGSGSWVDISDEAKLASLIKKYQNTASGGSGSTGGTDGSINADKILISNGHPLTAPSGGKITVQSGGTLNVESGGILRIASTLYISRPNGSWIDIGNEEKLEKFVKDHQNNVTGGSGSTGGTDGSTGSSITASSIFQQANEDSSITLNADKILINNGHPLTVQSGGNINVQSGGKITSTNFNIDPSGAVSIAAGGLKIKGRNNDWFNIGDEAALEKFVKDHQDTVSGESGSTGGTDGSINADKIIINKDHHLNVQNLGKINVQSGGNINVEDGGILRIASTLYISSSDGGWIDIGNENKLKTFINNQASSILQEANTDPKFTLNANKINLSEGYNLIPKSGIIWLRGTSEFRSDNFNIYSDKDVDIKADRLQIKEKEGSKTWIDISDGEKLKAFITTVFNSLK